MTDRDQRAPGGGEPTRTGAEPPASKPPKSKPAKPPPKKPPAGPLKLNLPRPEGSVSAPAAPRVARAPVPDAREAETLTVERLAQPKTSPLPDKEPVSQVQPVVMGPQPGDGADKYIGAVIDGRYKVLEVLGEGGMGVVYRCRRRIFDNEVAVKILRSGFAGDPEAVERFVTEAKAASAIGHAHIVNVFDFGELPDGSVYFAMEYVEGRTLGDYIESGELLGTKRIARIGRQIAEGLGAAHQAGIVHRDLKPENVFIIQRDGDFAKILDFGIAKVIGAQNKITRAGAVFGTPHYMAPEQCRGTLVDERTDIYALGVLLYEMATGVPPFDAENPLGILSQHLNDAPLPPSKREGVPELPPGLEAVISKCLAKEPPDRYQQMAEVAQALGQVERGEIEDVPVTVSLDSSVPPPPDSTEHEYPPRTPLPSAPFLLSRRSMPDIPRAEAFEARAVHAPPSSKQHAPLTLTAIVDDADVQAFKKAQRARRWPMVLGVIALLLGTAWATHGVWLPSPALMSEAMQAGRPLVLVDHAAETQPVAPKPNVSSVALVLSPIDAQVYRGSELLGSMPISVDVTPGDKLKLSVKREGFWTRKIVIDGTKPKILVRLAPIPGARVKVPVPKQPAAAASGAEGEEEAVEATAEEEAAPEPAPKEAPKPGTKGKPAPKEAPEAPSE